MKSAIAAELKATRDRKKITASKVSKDNGFNIETLRRYENNSIGLSVERLEKLLKYYDVDVDIFFRNVCENMHYDKKYKKEEKK